MEKLKFNNYQIKLFMAFLMVFDHLHYLGSVFPNELTAIFHVLTRVVGVWFAYGAVEGFLYTSNVKKYIIRLFSWALFMFLGNNAINHLYASKNIVINNNIFLTLGVGVLMLYCIKNLPNKILKIISTIIFILIGFRFCEGGVTLIPFMLITYLTYGNNLYRNIAYFVLSAILFAISFVDYGDFKTTMSMLAYNSDFMFIFIIPVLNMYNGKRGKNTKFSKYFFYVFYPLHLWIIATIAWFIA